MKQLIIKETFSINSISGMYFYIEPLNATSGCGHDNYSYFINGERKVEIWLLTHKKRFTNYWHCQSNNSIIWHERYETSIEVRGKKWNGRKWKKYKTSLEYKEVTLEINVPEQIGLTRHHAHQPGISTMDTEVMIVGIPVPIGMI